MAAADLSSVVPPSAVPISVPKPKQKAANTSTLGTLENDLVSQTKQAEQDTTKYQDSVAKITQDFHDQLGELKSQAPKVPDVKPFEAPEQVNPISAFGSSAGLLAGIASLFTRAPLTASLNAISSGMKAINDGNATNYQRAYDEFKTNTDYAFKAFDAEGKQYDRLLDLAKTDYDGALNGIKTLATMTDDKAMQTASAMKGIEGVESLNIERARLAQETQLNSYKMIPAKILDESINEFKIKNGRNPNSDELGQLYQKAQSSGVGGMESTAQMIASYQMPMPSGYALKNMGGDSLVTLVRQLNPDYNAVKYGAINKAYDAFTSGPASNLVTSGNVAIQHLSMLRDAASALKNGDIQAYNAVKQRYLQATGSSIPTNFDAISNIAADELVKFIVGGGKTGGALTDREGMKQLLSKASSNGQLSDQLDDYVGLMAGQMNGQRKKYESDDLDYIKPFDSFLLPDTQAALAAHGGGSSKPAGSDNDFSHLWK